MVSKKVQMVSKVARNQFGSREKRHFCCDGVGNWSMPPTKVSNCSHGQALSFEHSQHEQLAEGRALREFTPSGSLKKSSFFIPPKYYVWSSHIAEYGSTG